MILLFFFQSLGKLQNFLSFAINEFFEFRDSFSYDCKLLSISGDFGDIFEDLSFVDVNNFLGV